MKWERTNASIRAKEKKSTCAQAILQEYLPHTAFWYIIISFFSILKNLCHTLIDPSVRTSRHATTCIPLFRPDGLGGVLRSGGGPSYAAVQEDHYGHHVDEPNRDDLRDHLVHRPHLLASDTALVRPPPLASRGGSDELNRTIQNAMWRFFLLQNVVKEDLTFVSHSATIASINHHFALGGTPWKSSTQTSPVWAMPSSTP